MCFLGIKYHQLLKKGCYINSTQNFTSQQVVILYLQLKRLNPITENHFLLNLMLNASNLMVIVSNLMISISYYLHFLLIHCKINLTIDIRDFGVVISGHFQSTSYLQLLHQSNYIIKGFLNVIILKEVSLVFLKSSSYFLHIFQYH